eukprot:3184023-Amphidinium_carterae.1
MGIPRFQSDQEQQRQTKKRTKSSKLKLAHKDQHITGPGLIQEDITKPQVRKPWWTSKGGSEGQGNTSSLKRARCWKPQIHTLQAKTTRTNAREEQTHIVKYAVMPGVVDTWRLHDSKCK